MEFAEYREYQPGDDLRHVDVHAYARFGRAYVKRYAAEQGLDIAILLDATDSMNYGRPTKREVAWELARVLVHLAQAGGDHVRLATFHGDHDVRWRSLRTASPSQDGKARLRQPAGAECDLRAVARAAEEGLSSTGMTVVISDWWTADAPSAVRTFARTGREVVAVQVVAPEEEDPRMMPAGPALLSDAESGERLDLALGPEAFAAYDRGLAAWRSKFHASVELVRGRTFTVRTDRRLADVVLGDWRETGFLA